jgi:anti-sigma factor RsiW
MTTPHIDDDLLQRYFDGDLPDDEAGEVRHAVEASADEQERLERLARLRGLMRMAAEDMALDVGADALFGRISDDVRAGERRGGLRAIEGGRGRGPAIVTGVVLALAAAVTLAVVQPWQVQDEAPQARFIQEKHREAIAEAPTGARQGSEVVHVDFGGNTGTVFEVEGAAGQPLAVVWIDEGVFP